MPGKWTGTLRFSCSFWYGTGEGAGDKGLGGTGGVLGWGGAISCGARQSGLYTSNIGYLGSAIRSWECHFFPTDRGKVLQPKLSNLNLGTEAGPCLASHLACSLRMIGSTFSLECSSSTFTDCLTGFAGFAGGTGETLLRSGETLRFGW